MCTHLKHISYQILALKDCSNTIGLAEEEKRNAKKKKKIALENPVLTSNPILLHLSSDFGHAALTTDARGPHQRNLIPVPENNRRECGFDKILRWTGPPSRMLKRRREWPSAYLTAAVGHGQRVQVRAEPLNLEQHQGPLAAGACQSTANIQSA